jgi:lysozyme
MKAVFVGAGALLFLLALAWLRRPGETDNTAPESGEFSNELEETSAAGTLADLVTFQPLMAKWEAMTVQSKFTPQVQAFLSMIAVAEGTARAPDPYAVCYAYRHTIQDFSDHPAVTGEWRGERLSDAMCRGANMAPGCVSTAAGRYQIIKPTWLSVKKALALPDFGAESQDAAAVYLIRRRGAMDAVEAGRVAEAVELCRKEWASLPGAGYGQGERKLADLQAAFERAGGVLA